MTVLLRRSPAFRFLILCFPVPHELRGLHGKSSAHPTPDALSTRAASLSVSLRPAGLKPRLPGGGIRRVGDALPVGTHSSQRLDQQNLQQSGEVERFPSLEDLLAAIAEPRAEFAPKILAARRGKKERGAR